MTENISRWLGLKVMVSVRRFLSALWHIEARIKGATCDPTVVFIGRPIITVAPNSVLNIGRNAKVTSALRSNPLACFQPCVIRTWAPNARLSLGANTGLSGTVVCAVLSIEIGEGTLIGSGAMIIDNDFHELSPEGWREASPSDARPIKIGRDVFIGARAIILKGVTIGDRAVVGAGAVITRDVPANCLATGNPASIRPKKTGARKIPA